MGSRKLTKDDIEFKICGDFYNILQKFYEPEEADEFWDEFIEAGKKFSKKYNNVLADQLVIAIGRVLEHKRQNKK